MAVNVVVTATGPLLTLLEAKQHLRVDGDDEDTLIQAYADAAVARVLQYCNLSLVPDGPVPEAAFKAAALLTLGELFDVREVGSSDARPMLRTVTDLIDPYRWLRV